MKRPVDGTSTVNSDRAKDYYAVLGLLPTAELVVIKAAYKALAQRYHPDKFTGDPDVGRLKMAELNEAYGVLSNSQQRRVHDQELMDDLGDVDKRFAAWIRALIRARKHGD